MLRRDFNKLLCLLPIAGGSIFGSNTTSTVEQTLESVLDKHQLIYHQKDYLHPFFRAFKATLLTKAQEGNLVEGNKLPLRIFDDPILQQTGRFGFYGFTEYYRVGFSIDAKLEELQSIVESVPTLNKQAISLVSQYTYSKSDFDQIKIIYHHLRYLVMTDPDLSKVYRLA